MGKEDMNSKEKQDRVEELAGCSLEFFGEELDRVFESFFEAASAGDDVELVYASVAAWQLANSIGRFFREVSLAGLKNGSGDKGRAQAIATAMSQRFKDGMQKISGGTEKLLPSGTAGTVPEKEPYENIQDYGVLMKAGKMDGSLN